MSASRRPASRATSDRRCASSAREAQRPSASSHALGTVSSKSDTCRPLTRSNDDDCQVASSRPLVEGGGEALAGASAASGRPPCGPTARSSGAVGVRCQPRGPVNLMRWFTRSLSFRFGKFSPMAACINAHARGRRAQTPRDEGVAERPNMGAFRPALRSASKKRRTPDGHPRKPTRDLGCTRLRVDLGAHPLVAPAQAARFDRADCGAAGRARSPAWEAAWPAPHWGRGRVADQRSKRCRRSGEHGSDHAFETASPDPGGPLTLLSARPATSPRRPRGARVS